MNHEIQTAVDSLIEQLDRLLDFRPCKNKLIRLDEPIVALDLLNWLASVSAPKGGKVYWSDREGDLAVAGIASAWDYNCEHSDEITTAFQQAHKVMASTSYAACFSYFSFSDKSDCLWSAFGYGRVWLPLIEVTETRKGCVLACHVWVAEEQDWYAEIESIKTLLSSLTTPRIKSQYHFKLGKPTVKPSYQGWSEQMQKAKAALVSGDLDKVVLSREVSYPLCGNLSPWQLLKCWKEANVHSYSFLIEGKDEHYFLGCSPERLLKRHHDIIGTEALAGTSRRGESRTEDQQMAAHLMSDHKNIYENRLVLNDILDRLNPLCKWLDADRSHSILKLKNVQHLRYAIRGVLKPGVADEALVQLLHPTPAVGGTPRASAVEFIHQHEAYARGLYSGVFGVVGDDLTELSVSIRSACLSPGKLTLFSGAGIVKDSSVDSEWRELDNKLATVQTILSGMTKKHRQSCNDIDEVSHTLP